MSNIQLPLPNGDTLLVNSNWDSGRHFNFQAGVVDPTNPYTVESLDKHLSKHQIQTLEVLLASHIAKMLKE